MKVVISQPMFFPWLGLFEQIHLADIYVHLDDVQIPGGQSFVHRVQLKGPEGVFWWNAPIKRQGSLCNINQVAFMRDERWVNKSLKTLSQILVNLPYKEEAIALFRNVVDQDFRNLAEFNIYAIESFSFYMGLKTTFKRVEAREVSEDKTLNLINMLKPLKATCYISGLGGLNYIKQDMFSAHSIELKYMRYEHKQYEQKFGMFNPYVSVLHPIAALGPNTKGLLISKACYATQLSEIKEVNEK